MTTRTVGSRTAGSRTAGSSTAELAADLAEARERTLLLTDHDTDTITRQHSPLLSPLVWDLAHIGQQEDFWLLRRGVTGQVGILRPEIEQLYDAFTHPRAERSALPLLSAGEARSFLVEVRDRVTTLLEQADGDPELQFPFAMIAQHEHQHDETMYLAHALLSSRLLPATPLPPGRDTPLDSVLIPGGPFVMGVDADDEPWSLDNERPAHYLDIAAFRIGRFPVTNGEWQQFIDAGGYTDARWWSAAGWAHQVQAELRAPLGWHGDGTLTRFGIRQDLDPREPVQHVSFYEAEAYARFAGARLPTEFEWEKACAWDPAASARRRWPWGSTRPTALHANLGGTGLGPAAAGAYPAGASAYGVEQLIGDVWEWTTSTLQPWPGFTPMLYDTYSMPFFGPDYRVLRGGSWAVHPSAVRPSFRNWDFPIRRQITSGLRLAWDVV